MKIFLTLALLCVSLFAHKLNLFTDYENQTLYISAYFANGNGCQNCEVKIKDKDKKLLQKTFTNKKGEVSIDIKEDLFYVSVDAKGGHIATKKISLSKEEKQAIKDNSFKSINKSDLEKENERLKAKVKALESKLENMNILKTIFALLVIIGLFYILKRVKR
ncbi:hypothetical protein CPG37_06290 [Malaciobacter canalis]|uniref:Cobalt/nickel ECF transporter CbiMNQO, S component CbiN n=1 Tax=Malaciobacter canalis TaxID=1912871 RepID=A0ABX4LQW1_9BACT|nr:hypothetical protein [Malaciobacter canalis]PHO09947.1 hypothetical protein CPG37_06290 [Malaciobacter canalis]QEE33761.1 cobalt/nickel ECF transporter CbiMNQO, S component CbiN [Malaciobacter canalis]